MVENNNVRTKEKKLKKVIKNIFIKLIYILLILIFLCDLVIIIKKIRHPEETPSIFGIKTFCIISGSMEPVISVNDIVITKKVKEEEIQKGDIIAFKLDGETITHRIINIEIAENGQKLYTTKGDANNIEDDEKIVYQDIEGKCINIIPKFGKVLLVLKRDGPI